MTARRIRIEVQPASSPRNRHIGPPILDDWNGLLSAVPGLREDTEAEMFFYANGNPNKLGQDMPEFEIADVSGKTVTAKDLVGKPTLITYWSTGCGWCQRMLDELRDWDKTKTSVSPFAYLAWKTAPAAL